MKRRAEAGRRRIDRDPPGRHWRLLTAPRRPAPLTAEDAAFVSLQNQGDFDELVVGTWFHLEQMSGRQWWMRVGDVTFGIHLPKGKPARVRLTEGRLATSEGSA